MPQALRKQPMRRWTRIGAVVVVAIAWLLVPSVNTFFFSILIIWLGFRLDSRVVAGTALVFLLTIPALLLLKQQARAEQVAVYVFLLIAITVMLQIAELARAPERPAQRPVVGYDIKPRYIPYHIRYMRARIDGILPPNLVYEYGA